MATELNDYLKTSGASFAEAEPMCVDHFGDVPGELSALETGAVVCPLPSLIRIRVSGSDRAKFLHNFCTNNINNLKTHHCCEAFFTNVQARVLAHGYVAAGDDVHEIWMLPGDRDALVNHLDRYIITEDVVIEGNAPDGQAFAVTGAEVSRLHGLFGTVTESIPVNTWSAGDNGAALTTSWDDHFITFVSCNHVAAVDVWTSLMDSGVKPIGNRVFEYLRIVSRFPLVGQDIDEQNLAPEAARNDTAISYTKGCYLGQEPIARIDAMGHVNRSLCQGVVTKDPSDEETPRDKLPRITSLSDAAPGKTIGLLMSRQPVSGKAITAVNSSGEAVSLVVQ